MNKTCASGWLRGYMEILQTDLEKISEEFNIPVERLAVECKEPFWADEFLALCAYFDVDVDRLIKRNDEYDDDDDEEYYETESYNHESDSFMNENEEIQ